MLIQGANIFFYDPIYFGVFMQKCVMLIARISFLDESNSHKKRINRCAELKYQDTLTYGLILLLTNENKISFIVFEYFQGFCNVILLRLCLQLCTIPQKDVLIETTAKIILLCLYEDIPFLFFRRLYTILCFSFSLLY